MDFSKNNSYKTIIAKLSLIIPIELNASSQIVISLSKIIFEVKQVGIRLTENN